MDKKVASSGESFISYLSTLDNVLFVGTNTLGCDLVGNNLSFYLPHSKLRLYLGTNLSFNNISESKEGIGYLPDIWIGSTDALERVIAMCRNYLEDRR